MHSGAASAQVGHCLAGRQHTLHTSKQLHVIASGVEQHFNGKCLGLYTILLQEECVTSFHAMQRFNGKCTIKQLVLAWGRSYIDINNIWGCNGLYKSGVFG